MADPLKLLQEYTTGKREIRELTHKGKLYYAFGDVAYAHDASTNFQVYNKQDEYYTLESILQLWKNQDLQHQMYVKNVSGRGIQPVTRMQRRELIEYLKGSQPSLSSTANVLAPIPTPVPVSRLTADEEQPERKRPRMEPERNQRPSEQPTLPMERITEVRGLSNELSAEKIAQLRNKVKNNLAMNKMAEDDGTASGDGLLADSSSDAVGIHLKAKERIGKNRLTCLEGSQQKDFSTVLYMLGSYKDREQNAQQRQKQNIPPASQQPQQPSLATRQPADGGNSQNGRVRSAGMNVGYSRYDQEIYTKDPITDQFNVVTNKSFSDVIQSWSKATNSQQQPSSSQPPPPPQPARRNEIAASHQQQQQQSAPPPKPQKRVSRTPIIIVPATETSLITMYNAIDILQDLKFVPTDEKKKTTRRENEALLQRKKPDGSTVPYRVLDNPLRLRDDEWDRVVAVFVQGAAWQFKGWKWRGNPVEIFANVAAFHMKYEDQKLDPNVANWSVKVLSVSKTKRHLDKANLQRIWDTLDRFIAKNKPHLRA